MTEHMTEIAAIAKELAWIRCNLPKTHQARAPYWLPFADEIDALIFRLKALTKSLPPTPGDKGGAQGPVVAVTEPAPAVVTASPARASFVEHHQHADPNKMTIEEVREEIAANNRHHAKLGGAS